MNVFPGGKESGLFNVFIAPETDRLLFLQRLLATNKVPCSVITLRGRFHIIVRFGTNAYNPFFRMKTIIAHYDRERAPGANDNSAACFQLVDLAVKLLGRKDHNIRIIFTGAEEAGSGGVAAQGAFALGLGLRKLKLTDSDIFVFDACGRGDTLVLSMSGLYSRSKKRPQVFAKKREALFSTAVELAQKSCAGRWLSLPTPYSDNAGLTAAGVPAQLVTVLPHEEAATLLAETTRRAPQSLQACTREGDGRGRTHTQKTKAEAFERGLLAFTAKGGADTFIPQTWKDMHSGDDTAEKLTPSAFSLIERYLNALADSKTPC